MAIDTSARTATVLARGAEPRRVRLCAKVAIAAPRASDRANAVDYIDRRAAVNVKIMWLLSRKWARRNDSVGLDRPCGRVAN